MQTLLSLVSQWKAAEWIAAASAGFALLAALAAFAGVFVQSRIATRQIKAQIKIAAQSSRASVVSASRQQWIDAVREDTLPSSSAPVAALPRWS